MAYGDLNLANPAHAKIFKARVNAASQDLCRAKLRAGDLDTTMLACVGAVRREVDRQLPAAQHQALAVAAHSEATETGRPVIDRAPPHPASRGPRTPWGLCFVWRARVRRPLLPLWGRWPPGSREAPPEDKLRAGGGSSAWAATPPQSLRDSSPAGEQSLKPSQRKRPRGIARGLRRLREARALKRLHDAFDHLLGVGEQHHRVVLEEQFVLDPGIARGHAALDEQDRAGLFDVQDRHAEDARWWGRSWRPDW
ncbi:UrcA family protein [Caulobacter segnis]